MSDELASIGDPVAVLAAMVAAEPQDAHQIGTVAAMLWEVASRVAVPALLPLLRHPKVCVRLGAVAGAATHPFPLVLKALGELYLDDDSKKVRDAAEKVLDDFDAAAPECIMCDDPAVLAPKPDPDPHREQLPRPMFCGTDCAVRFALGEAPDLYHLCVTVGRWERGPSDECNTCSDASVLGAEAEDPRTRGGTP